MTLFSEHGFDGVSVKEIATAVGIKDSSLYNHYKSKQEIFDTILIEATKILKEANNTYALPITLDASNIYRETTVQDLTKMYVDAFKYYLTDDTARKFRKVLVSEQHINPYVGNLYNELFFERPLEYLTTLFTDLVQQETFIKMDPYIIAMHFYAPINFLIRRCDIRPDLVKENIALLEKHIKQFDQIYRLDTD
ncbi:transcriptional regulator, TetR family [Enterococcus malodoratus]|uniref:TetR/AcrR family transcriptional regulator n=1 Tax=Enterococcus malodoratus TaxID=71451 RepID=UPI0008CCB9B5|nr:TetR/AcrR family transcriptional regulator [Enterococcus malodoratus]SET53944.1 transcriptional regulator, TetR family [Enterococcus malodoratus]